MPDASLRLVQACGLLLQRHASSRGREDAADAPLGAPDPRQARLVRPELASQQTSLPPLAAAV